MGKSYNGDKEWNELRRTKEENKKLRRQNNKLKKVIKNIDIQHYEFVQDLIESQESEDDNHTKKVTQEKLEENWKCHKCDNGIMRLITINRAGNPFYFRRCDSCDNKTKMQRFNEDVEGV